MYLYTHTHHLNIFRLTFLFFSNQSLLQTMKASNVPKFVVPAALVPFVTPMSVIAAEGTSRAFGIDDSRLILAALLPSFIIFPLYLN